MPVYTISIVARFGFPAALGLTLASAALTQATPAGQTAPAAATDPAAVKEKGRELFATWGCASCHSLADADATGHVGPSFDGDANLTKAFVIDRVTNGQGPMPAFGGQLTDEEINILAQYLVQVHKK